MDYKAILNLANKYFPSGIAAWDSRYIEYHGIKQFLEIVKQMFSDENYQLKWQGFINGLKDSTDEIQKVRWQSPLSDWCYTGSITLKNRSCSNITHIKEIIISMSFLAPVYTIFIQDRIELTENNNLIEFNPFLTISPQGEYGALFLFCKKKIENNYPEYKFISFELLSESVKDIAVPGSIDERDSTVYQVLFSFHDITRFPYQGEKDFE